jgi:hypothetical protein
MRYLPALYLALTICLWQMSCTGPSVRKKEQTKTVASTPVETDLRLSDTLILNPERQVLFFLPSDEEINRMADQYPDDQIIETITDFIYFSNMVCDTLSYWNIMCSPVTSRVIMTADTLYGAFTFERSRAPHFTGMIVYDGKSAPEIHYGVADYAEWMGIVKRKLNL